MNPYEWIVPGCYAAGGEVWDGSPAMIDFVVRIEVARDVLAIINEHPGTTTGHVRNYLRTILGDEVDNTPDDG